MCNGTQVYTPCPLLIHPVVLSFAPLGARAVGPSLLPRSLIEVVLAQVEAGFVIGNFLLAEPFCLCVFRVPEKCSPFPLVIGDFGGSLAAVRFEDRAAMPRCLLRACALMMPISDRLTRV
jgi:hypothetical protein